MLIAEVDAANVWLGQIREISDLDVCPPGWRIVNAPAPDLAADQVALVSGDSWVVISAADRPAVPAVRLPVISKIDFSRLFTGEQMVKYLALKAAAKALTPADFADPAKAVTIQAAVMFEKFGLLPDLIELDHPETIAGVGQILVAAGVLPAPEAERILANVPPAE